ncbi:ArsR/SmtB family transcription factor [Pectinatus brassicae]|uniref:ArsR family transcriptional regulator n=1 Tax=Pectinatus brassicae TaxID=862415 RepID=A0A840ULY4_9FIRM|nr:metalloregulator ArsR/SmtB family transcription factor [Pectinatus brassicae]MBB5335698.1 ArsR family transcriptional regulator [Pectinatus brassicae]
MSEDHVNRLTAEIFKALAHPVRIKILQMLKTRTYCVCEMMETMDVEQSNLSQHLNILKKQGLIDSEKAGQRVNYHIVHPCVAELIEVAEKLIGERLGKNQVLFDFLQ